jgi:hypothetical protein
METHYLHIIIFDKDMIQLEVFQLKKIFWSIPKTNIDSGSVGLSSVWYKGSVKTSFGLALVSKWIYFLRAKEVIKSIM